MKKFTYKRHINKKVLFYNLLLFVVVTTVIVYFLPREERFNYQYNVDKPWRYSQLIAPFEFPIYKSDAQVKEEKDSLLQEFTPYFNYDSGVGEQEVARFLKDNANNSNVADVKYISDALRRVYAQGIFPNEQLERLSSKKIKKVAIVNDKLSVPTDMSSIYSIKEAYNSIIHGDTLHFPMAQLRSFNINEYILPNLIYDKEKSDVALKDLMDSYSWASGMVWTGQKIVDRGEIVSPYIFNVLESLRKESIRRGEPDIQRNMIVGGQTLFVAFMVISFMIYLRISRRNYTQNRKKMLLMMGLITLFSVVTSLVISRNLFSVYIIPFAMLAILIRVFMDSRTAFLCTLIAVLICSISLKYPFEFILLQVSAAMVAVFSLKDLEQRSQLFKTVFLILLTYALLYFALELMSENDITKLNLRMYLYFVINAILLLFTYPLLFIVEKLFGFITNVTLVELSNINHPLLRQMSEVAPGTFQHSMQVANLAAAAANEIGANSQLVRTGALYHDIGKMENAAYYTENQGGGANPHQSLTLEESAQLVISHVTGGLKLAEKNNLPKMVRDFIPTHHGKSKASYFYRTWQNTHPGETPDDKVFTYPGPNPFTKEQVLLMMADSVEAASRSLPQYTEEEISKKVEEIINYQFNEGLFVDSPITFREIAKVKSVFKEKLKIMYHTRISYPELNNKSHEKQ